jgi:pimeloyl-ACP methyl ester carboxylesterase
MTETMMTPFAPNVPEAALDDLRRRLDLVRWPDAEVVDDWEQGVPLAKLQALVGYWRDEYDWRRCERRLGTLAQFTTPIDGLDIHFIHVRSPVPNALPIVITHGWPGSIIEFLDIVGPLTDPVAHGGRAEDAFHVVLPSLPGFGFSGKPTGEGWGVQRIARAWGVLMARLGYDRWVAQGGDWGAVISRHIASEAVPGCAAIHLNHIIDRARPEDRIDPNPAEAKAITAQNYHEAWGLGYSTQQQTRPQTVGYGLVDSPVALAAWIYEKMWAWTDNRGSPEDALSMDAMLDNITLYWLTGSGASAARLYWERYRHPYARADIHLPTAVSAFPREIVPSPRNWAERSLKNIYYWNELKRGGHFPAWEVPEVFVDEMRRAFAPLRPGGAG